MGSALRAAVNATSATPSKPGRTARRRRLRGWLNSTEWVLAGVAILFLLAYAWPILQPDLGPSWKRICSTVECAAWLVFLLDYGLRLWVGTGARTSPSTSSIC
ncbi:MAG: hypothetical protein ABR571_00725 [Jatrophihabitans sp.]|uniref:hypothetical protein n=1 Tax=Jatrophihabitans sp. TaxID=1932789 RepID=UPI003910B4A9